jgi:LuxR family quorum-sensing system transcriptional regulator CciR
MTVVTGFVLTARRAATLSELATSLGEAAQALGFHFFALVHHGDLGARRPRRIELENYPDEWRRRFVADRLGRADPVQRACRTSVTGFEWSRLSELVELAPRDRRVLEESRRHGLGDGFTVPLHLPGEPGASCSFAVRPGRGLPARHLPAAQLLGQFAFEAAHRMFSPPTRPRAGLSPRQRDCVLLVARGKSDWEIGAILGLSEETVGKYLQAARARYAVVRRTQLAIAALHDGVIGFDEVLRD